MALPLTACCHWQEGLACLRRALHSQQQARWSLQAVADWEEMAGAVAALAQHQRSSGFREVMDAGEAQQLLLVLQRHIAFELAEQAGSRLEALRLLAVAESASRRLCQLAPGRAACQLKWALDLAELQRTQEAAAAHRAALQAADASNGKLPVGLRW